MKLIKHFSAHLALLLLALPSGLTQAATWSHTEAAVFAGQDYQSVPGSIDYDQSVTTLKHASGWEYGDNFFFVDISEPDEGKSTYYGEFSPRFSLSKMTGNSWQAGPLKDVSLAYTREFGEFVSANLFGLGFDFDVPGFAFVQVNAYQRYSKSEFIPNQTGHGPQVTLVWAHYFHLVGADWVFEGFADYAWSEDAVGKHNNFISKPRLMIDLGGLLTEHKGSLYVGIEQMIWRNKFGAKGIDENITQLGLKWVF